MIELLCSCSWGIPGIDQLPAHAHRTLTKIRRANDGFEFSFNSSWLPQDGYDILSQEPIIIVSVDWKLLARSLSHTTADPNYNR